MSFFPIRQVGVIHTSDDADDMALWVSGVRLPTAWLVQLVGSLLFLLGSLAAFHLIILPALATSEVVLECLLSVVEAKDPQACRFSLEPSPLCPWLLPAILFLVAFFSIPLVALSAYEDLYPRSSEHDDAQQQRHIDSADSDDNPDDTDGAGINDADFGGFAAESGS